MSLTAVVKSEARDLVILTLSDSEDLPRADLQGCGLKELETSARLIAPRLLVIQGLR
jgi:hypothetical protein